MARKDLTDITLIVDRSGSMEVIREEAQVGINSFIKEQKEADGEALFTLIEFDSDYNIVYNGVPIRNVEEYVLKPRYMTALLDAIGNGILLAKNRIKKMSKKERPGLIVIAVITDGHENASKEFNKAKIKNLIEKYRKKDWDFLFLGADMGSIDEAISYGYAIGTYTAYDPGNITQTYVQTSNLIAMNRSNVLRGEDKDLTFKDEEK